jgi:hypothetical protein
MTTAFHLSQTRERLSAFLGATTMTLVVMTSISTLAQTERAEAGLQANARPVIELPVQQVVVTPVQQVLVTGQRQPRT